MTGLWVMDTQEGPWWFELNDQGLFWLSSRTIKLTGSWWHEPEVLALRPHGPLDPHEMAFARAHLGEPSREGIYRPELHLLGGLELRGSQKRLLFHRNERPLP